ncbi:MAG: restriction endonuclease [Kiritimatiellae bacterium]|jgi:restriction system protein|nr:restriction endonuclease [Kiritimatiellia bacterium]
MNRTLILISLGIGVVSLLLVPFAASIEKKKRKKAQIKKENEELLHKQELEKNSQDILNVLTRRVMEVIEPHLDTLQRKRKQLITKDDYGTIYRKKWDEELNYFYLNVLHQNDDLIQSEKNLQKTHLCLANKGIFLESSVEKIFAFTESVLDAKDVNSKLNEGNYSRANVPVDYTRFCAGQLKIAGWMVTFTKASDNQYIDIIAENNGIKIAIQCNDDLDPVLSKAVEKASAGASFYGADKCFVVSSTGFTSTAIDLANTHGVKLLHHDDLLGLTENSLKNTLGQVQTSTQPQTSEKQKTENTNIGVIFIILFLVLIFGSIVALHINTQEKKSSSIFSNEISYVEKQVLLDSMKQFNIAMKTKNYMDAYTRAGVISQLYLQAEDKTGYSEWKEREKSLGRKLGMPY